MTLDEARAGEPVRIVDILLESSRLQAIRLGIVPGAVVTVVQQLSRGPVIIGVGASKIALGRALARSVVVIPVQDF